MAWSETVLVPFLKDLAAAPAEDGVHVAFDFEPHVKATEVAEVVGSDLILAALPLPLGLIYLLLYTNSVFLAATAALQTAAAWPMALFLYRSIFGFFHYEELTLLASPLTAVNVTPSSQACRALSSPAEAKPASTTRHVRCVAVDTSHGTSS